MKREWLRYDGDIIYIEIKKYQTDATVARLLDEKEQLNFSKTLLSYVL